MTSLTLDNIALEELRERIDEVRDILNEICCTDQNPEEREQRLIISRNLDELIVKYMKAISR